MKKLFVIIILVVLLVGCGKGSDRSELLKEPRYKDAIARAEVGYVFYQDENLVGIDMPGVGVFLSEYKKGNMLAAFNLDYDKLKDMDISVYMSKSLDKILIHAGSMIKSFGESKFFAYDIKSKKLEEITEKEYQPLDIKEGWNMSVKNILKDPFNLKNFIFVSESDGKEYRIFENVDIK